MWTATLGATPVKACTCAASSTFSCGVRGTPGWPNTLNLVPVLPNAHEGNSIRCSRSAVFTAVRSGISSVISRGTSRAQSRWQRRGVAVAQWRVGRGCRGGGPAPPDGQKLKLLTFAELNTVGGPSSTVLSAPIVYLTSLPAVKVCPAALVIFLDARFTAA